MNTKFTSGNTTPPAIIKKIAPYLKDAIIFDFGCGRYWEKTRKFIFDNGAEMYTPYDKYWEIGDIPKYPAKYTHIICANVLNVIESNIEMIEALITIKDISNRSTKICIQIYEGDRSGKGRPTKKGYQRNQKTKYYINFISAIFTEDEYAINRNKNFIFIDKLPW